ncbi:hypothetical protein [Alteromonas sp. a30]|uniref:hypothetical protein n=1 Tax=Alteromonas sp. a30 TaxID=2730917 RepID=UPI00228124F2|nr:hypothetical protein [Alteromonas sp. a30]MCY7294186.1 hypothetical protein [Alteromonas sp. a30]
MSVLLRNIGVLITCASSFTLPVQAQTQIKGLIQGQYALITDDEKSFLYGGNGTGLFKFDDEHDSPEISQALIQFTTGITSTLEVEGVLNHTRIPNTFTQFSQLNLRYRPLWSARYRWQFRAGMFYPQFGFENPDIGWQSPFNYTNSAISSWIGEELRTLGGEAKLTLPGRVRRSPHTFELIGSLYKSNDTTGTLLSWRGWSFHDKQALYNEKINFAALPSLQRENFVPLQASRVEPFREIDGKWGVYLGAHWNYKHQSKLRYYYYNNQADENIVARGGQYAWQTLFHSVSWQYLINRNLRFIAQFMDGNTSMGINKVNVDFRSWYGLLSQKIDTHRVSLRYDYFKTVDKDQYPSDQNDSDGFAITASYRYDWTPNIQLGLEYIYTDRFQANRVQWGWDPNITQEQLLAVAQYRF